jgi:hypothetical protein
MSVLETLRMISRNRSKSPAWARRLPKGRWEIPNP